MILNNSILFQGDDCFKLHLDRRGSGFWQVLPERTHSLSHMSAKLATANDKSAQALYSEQHAFRLIRIHPVGALSL